MLTVIICGASGSGKTSLANNIAKEMEASSVTAQVIMLDSYYKCHPELSFDERTKLNYDAPYSFDFDLLKSDIELLRKGIGITTKKYDYASHLRRDTNDIIAPPQVLILEGIHSFADEEILNSCDLRVYVDTDTDVCVLRRIRRDMKKRDRTVDSIIEQYLDTVKPMLDKHIKQYKADADICVVGGGQNKRAIKVITQYINSLIAQPVKN